MMMAPVKVGMNGRFFPTIGVRHPKKSVSLEGLVFVRCNFRAKKRTVDMKSIWVLRLQRLSEL